MVGNCMKDHARWNNILDKSQLGTCPGVWGNVKQLIIDNPIMDIVRNKQRIFSAAFHDCQKAYDMVKHDTMTRVYKWMGVPERVVNVIIKLTGRWKTRLKVTDNEKVLTNRTFIIIRKVFLQGDSYSMVWFCLTEVSVSFLKEEPYGCTMGQRDEERVHKTNSLFIDDLTIYQEIHQKSSCERNDCERQHGYWRMLRSKEMYTNYF